MILLMFFPLILIGAAYDPLLCRNLYDILRQEEAENVLMLGPNHQNYVHHLQNLGINCTQVANPFEKVEDKYDWIVSFETAENIDPAKEDAFLDNISKIGPKGIILSWAYKGLNQSINAKNNNYVRFVLMKRDYLTHPLHEMQLRLELIKSYLRPCLLVFVRKDFLP